jgi:hypothetical protein
MTTVGAPAEVVYRFRDMSAARPTSWRPPFVAKRSIRVLRDRFTREGAWRRCSFAMYNPPHGEVSRPFIAGMSAPQVAIELPLYPIFARKLSRLYSS